MPVSEELTPIQFAWINYVQSVRALLVPQVDDRPLDQFLVFRDSVLKLVQGPQCLEALDYGWTGRISPPNDSEVNQMLLPELEAFPRAVEVSQAAASPEEEKVGGKAC
jgi:hypothetical protein